MKKFRHIIGVVCILLCIPVLSACSSVGNEPNDSAFVVAIGFDKAEDEIYDVTIQFAKATQISGGASEEGGKTGEGISQNLTVEAPNIYSAMDTANHIISKKFSLSHAKLIVFSEEVAREGVSDIIDSIIRNDEIRPDVFLAVSKNSAGEYLTEVKPVIEINPVKYYQLVYGNKDAGGVPKMNLQSFYFDKELKNRNSVLPLAGVAQTDTENKEKNKLNDEAKVNEGGFEYKIKNYTAGEVAIVDENKSEAMGMAVFKEDKMVGVLGSIDCEIYNLLCGDLKKSYLSLKDDETGKSLIVKAYEVRKPMYNVDIKEKKVKIRLFIESELYSKPNDRNNFDINKIQENSKRYIEEACTEFIVNARDEMQCDIMGIGEKVKYKFLVNKSFNEYDFQEDFKNYDIEIDAKFKIRRTGMKF